MFFLKNIILYFIFFLNSSKTDKTTTDTFHTSKMGTVRSGYNDDHLKKAP